MPYSDPQKQRDFQKNWKRQKKLWFQKLKSKLECSQCGFSHPATLQFHHKNDDKTDTVSRMVNKNSNVETIMAEIAKCDVLCANCHAIHHWENDHKK